MNLNNRACIFNSQGGRVLINNGQINMTMRQRVMNVSFYWTRITTVMDIAIGATSRIEAGVGEIKVGTGKIRVGAVEIRACTVNMGTVVIEAGAAKVDVGAVMI